MSKIVTTTASPARMNGRFEIITAEKRWLVCNGNPVGCCTNAYEADSHHESLNPTEGEIHVSQSIGRFYLCPDCNENYEEPVLTPEQLEISRRLWR